LSDKETLDLKASNPVWSIGHRTMQTSMVGSVHVTSAEFSIASALTNVGSLSALLRSKNSHDRKIAQQLLKTAAVLMFVKKNSVPYTPIAKRSLISANP
jgi:hypothetical protein